MDRKEYHIASGTCPKCKGAHKKSILLDDNNRITYDFRNLTFKYYTNYAFGDHIFLRLHTDGTWKLTYATDKGHIPIDSYVDLYTHNLKDTLYTNNVLKSEYHMLDTDGFPTLLLTEKLPKEQTTPDTSHMQKGRSSDLPGKNWYENSDIECINLRAAYTTRDINCKGQSNEYECYKTQREKLRLYELEKACDECGRRVK